MASYLDANLVVNGANLNKLAAVTLAILMPGLTPSFAEQVPPRHHFADRHQCILGLAPPKTTVIGLQ